MLASATLQATSPCGARFSAAGCCAPAPLRAPLRQRQPQRSGLLQRQGPRQAVAAAAAPAAAAAAAVLTPAVVFDAATLFVLPFYTLMVLAPRARLTQRLLSGTALLLAAAALYVLLLLLWAPLPQLAGVASDAVAAVAAAARAGAPAAAWRAAQPSMPAFAALFGRPEVTALAWVHLVLLDLVQARWVHLDGQRYNIRTQVSAVLCFMVGPLGLLCHLATKATLRWWRSRGRKDDDYIIYRF
ncbi:hypothetical protein ABPG75_007156 [Micractinium tetrahymenae]